MEIRRACTRERRSTAGAGIGCVRWISEDEELIAGTYSCDDRTME